MRFRRATAQTTGRCAELRVARCNRCSDHSQPNHTAASGEGDEAVPERIDGGGYGFGLFVAHDTRFGHFVSPLGRAARLRVEHAVAPWTRRRRDRAGQLDLRADVGDGSQDVGDRRRARARSPHVPVVPSAALLDAAHRLAALLSDWTDSAADELFADNVALDDSFDQAGTSSRRTDRRSRQS